MKNYRHSKSVKLHRRDYLNVFAFQAVCEYFINLGYKVKVI